MKTHACILLLSFCTVCFSQAGRSITRIVSAASGAPALAPDSIASIYGINLTDRTESATGLPLPIQLGGVTIVVSYRNDTSAGTVQGQLLYASPSQINFVVPAGIPVGMDTVMVVGPEIIYAQASVSVQAVVPAIFTANGTGGGVAAAIGIRQVIPTNIQSTVDVFSCDAPLANCHAIPINVGIDAPVTLELFGTGIRGGKNVTATIGGQPVPVAYAGPQPQFPGLDQVNLPLILSLRGAGTVDVVVTVDGQVSNPVQIAIQ